MALRMPFSNLGVFHKFVPAQPSGEDPTLPIFCRPSMPVEWVSIGNCGRGSARSYLCVSRHPLTGTFCRHCAPLHVCACRLPVQLWHLLSWRCSTDCAAAEGVCAQAQDACAGLLASGVPAHLLQRTSGCDLAAASPASCVGGLSSRGVGIACNSGACFSTRTQPGRGLLAVKC